MSCQNCGSPCQGHRCRECEMIAACEARHGTSAGAPDDVKDESSDEWGVEQTGLDGEGVNGQATFSGAVLKEGDSDE